MSLTERPDGADVPFNAGDRLDADRAAEAEQRLAELGAQVDAATAANEQAPPGPAPPAGRLRRCGW